ncbi:MAG: hydrogen peroxide-inducible genes activator [Hyphomicrobiales bacterium]
MNNLTLKQLRYVQALAQTGHFGRAADLCAISQPALSLQIKEVEDHLGVALFERDTRQVRLTSFGETFVDRARDILRSVQDLEDFARNEKGTFLSRLRMGIIPTIAPYLLPALVSDLKRDTPEIDIHIRETVTPRLIEDLTQGRIDTAIVALPVSEPSFEEAPLITEHFVFVRPKSDDRKPVPSVEMLQEMRLLLLEEGHCFRDQALEFCNLTLKRPRETLDGSSLATLVQMVDAGLGVTLIPEMAVPIETRSASVSVIRFGKPEPTRTIGMIWRKSNPLAPAFKTLSDMVKMTAQRLNASA